MSPADHTARLRAWEAAYRRFETPEQERSKFVRRLRALGATTWDRDLRITEIFCGRGNGLQAWHDLGFTNVEGLDISADLLAAYDGPARTYEADARALPFEDATRDVIAVQGGLHHLELPDDLDRTLAEVVRVLKPGGRLLAVEPWRTRFLDLAHAACGSPWLRALWPRLEALDSMIDLERDTYEDWLGRPEEILSRLRAAVEPTILRIGWGKLMLLGTRRATSAERS